MRTIGALREHVVVVARLRLERVPKTRLFGTYSWKTCLTTFECCPACKHRSLGSAAHVSGARARVAHAETNYEASCKLQHLFYSTPISARATQGAPGLPPRGARGQPIGLALRNDRMFARSFVVSPHAHHGDVRHDHGHARSEVSCQRRFGRYGSGCGQPP